MKWDDLLGIKYKANGRTKAGFDCYGVVLECCRRAGHPLPDLEYKGGMSGEELKQTRLFLDMIEVPAEERKEGDILQCFYAGALHSGYLVNRDTVLHTTFTGVRTSPVTAFKDAKFYRGKSW